MLYNHIISYTLCGAVLFITACAPNNPIKTSNIVYNTAEMGFLEIGRAVSNNTVDIYDPNAIKFMVSPPTRAIKPKPHAISYNNNIITDDDSVKVYSLTLSNSNW